MKQRACRAAILICGLQLTQFQLAGCQTTSPTARKSPSQTIIRSGSQSREDMGLNTARGDTVTLSPDQSLMTDPCAARLQDISGQLLLFYALNRKLPDKLDDLKS